MRKEKWVWMGHAGHFICGAECQFRLNTYVGKYIVSTVGELWNDREVRKILAKSRNPKWFNENQMLKGDAFDAAYRKKWGFEDIGCDRKYETAVFKAKKSNHKCCPYEAISWEEIDFCGYNTAEEAYAGHLRMCNKWSKKIERRKYGNKT